jgi:hypothetical protein
MQISFTLHPELVPLWQDDTWGEHEIHTRDEWEQEAGMGNTQLGYWEWASHKLEAQG